MLQNLQDLFTLIATGSGIYVAIGGLNAWRRETTGKRDIELCQNVIERFYEAEQKMNVLRAPMSYSHEGESRAKEANETAEETERRNSLFVPLARMNQQTEFWSDFFSYMFRMRALFGEPSVGAFEKVSEAVSSFRTAASIRYQGLYTQAAGINPETRTKLEQKIWAGTSTPDVIADQMKAAIVEMEGICVPIVRSTQPAMRKWWKRF